jgi:hypothetical protein
MKMQIFATLDKAKPDTGNTRLGGGQACDRSSDYTAVVVGATEDRACSGVLSLDLQRPYIYCICIH